MCVLPAVEASSLADTLTHVQVGDTHQRFFRGKISITYKPVRAESPDTTEVVVENTRVVQASFATERNSCAIVTGT